MSMPSTSSMSTGSSFLHFLGIESHSLGDYNELPCHGFEYPQPDLHDDVGWYSQTQRSHYLAQGMRHLETFTASKAHLYKEKTRKRETPRVYICVEGRYQSGDVDTTIYACFERLRGPIFPGDPDDNPGMYRYESDSERPWVVPECSSSRALDTVVQSYQPQRSGSCTLCSTLTFVPPIPFFSITVLGSSIHKHHLIDGRSNYLFAATMFEVLRKVYTSDSQMTIARGAGGLWYSENIYNSSDILSEYAIAWYLEDWKSTTDAIQACQDEMKAKLVTAVREHDFETQHALTCYNSELQKDLERLSYAEIERLRNLIEIRLRDLNCSHPDAKETPSIVTSP
ncbi:hypothetical protein BDN70DRAFT_988444, partial [Pholiota conissans]